ncbi:MAG: phosphoribosylformylglycinamidine synthase subunit PurL [Nitrospirae bacterium]|nr:phosphoribosylformylglycinamidine synthase subunit PurL [Nitrospirota bacterium]
MIRGEPPVDERLALDHGLTKDEYLKIVKLMDRVPTFTELGIFSVMWSEHCSYKSSRIHLKKFPTKGERVIFGPGENAGVVDIGEGMAAVFKMESHNHPSFIEPYQGAATGVGGILRDVFTMGARPVALLNSLRFGSLEKAKNRTLFAGVVSGIAGYGNCMGVPTLGGEVCFYDIYDQNPLVNAFCLGLVQKNRIFLGQAAGVGNPIIYVGSKTGRDGIHGASLLASSEFNDTSMEKRPAVQVGDPFTEKLLLEACLELMSRDIVVGIQDMGAAGLTSSSCEMAGRAGTGVEMDVLKVPLREVGMTPYEIMLSESQERMLLVARQGCEKEVLEIFEKWDLDAAVIGRVTGDGKIRIKSGDRLFAEIPVVALVEDAPVYERPLGLPPYQQSIQTLQMDLIHLPKDYNRVLKQLLASPTIANKEWVYDQYDHMVQTNVAIRPGGDASLIRIKGSTRAIAVSVGGNSLYTLLNPHVGGMIAVAEVCRNLVCTGAKPLAITDCLNFGSPERPDIMWQFSMAIEGIADACRKFSTPVVSGNVSFYNETKGVAIYPTPTVGAIGLLENIEKRMTCFFKSEGDVVILLGKTGEDLGGTEYMRIVHHQERGFPPLINLDEEYALHQLCLELIDQELVHSAHDCSEGGLAVALAESCIASPLPKGAEIRLPETPLRPDALLFGESQSRIIISAPPAHVNLIEAISKKHRVPFMIVGVVKSESLVINSWISIPLDELTESWRNAIPKMMVNG